MKLIKNNHLFVTYLVFFLASIILFFLLKLPLSPLTLTFGFFLILLLPGFSLSRIIKYEGKKNFDKIISWVTLGFIVIFGLILIAIFLGVTMQILITSGLVLFIILFGIALFLDIQRKETDYAYYLPKLSSFKQPNFYLGLVLVVLVMLSMIVLDGLGGLFKGGDPSFHLAIVKKAYEGTSLSALSLSLVKGSIHITYGYPVWHVFLGALARIFNSDIFILWRTVVIPVSLLSIFICYWLIRKVMPNKSLAIFTVIAFLVYILNKNTAFLFTCISIPDTLNNLIFFPLTIGLSLNYILNASAINLKKDWLGFAIIALISIFMAIIHLTQFFYLLMVIFIFGLVYYLFFIKEKASKQILIKSGLVLGANLVILLPLTIVLMFKSNAIETISGLLSINPSEVFPTLAYYSFAKFNTLAKYAYIFLPFLLLFVRKNRNLVFLVALFMIVPIVYSEPVKYILMQTLGYIFVNRMYGSLVWHFAIWGFAFGVVFLLIDKLMKYLAFGKKYLKLIINLLALGALALFVFLQTKLQFANKFYEGLYNTQIDSWMNRYYGLVILILIIIGLGIFYLQGKKEKFAQSFDLKESQTLWMPILAVCFVLLMLNYNKTEFFKWFADGQKHGFLYSATTYDPHATYVGAGGDELVAFINQNLPRKSVILVPGNIVFSLPIVTDQYMAGYPRSSVLDRYLMLYSDKYPDDVKLTNLKKSKINYILVNRPNSQNIGFFERYPEIFKPIYKNSSIIFKVENIK